jgi:hypothetical protein
MFNFMQLQATVCIDGLNYTLTDFYATEGGNELL